MKCKYGCVAVLLARPTCLGVFEFPFALACALEKVPHFVFKWNVQGDADL